MEISDIRRARLRLWFASRTLPPKEKSYISQLLSGTASFGERAARRLERDYGMGHKYLDQPVDSVSNVDEAPELRSFRNVPVVGTVQGGDNGFFTELEYPVGHGDGNITYPAKDENSYALRVRGDSMRPRIKNGEFIVVEPNQATQPGDDVVVCLKDGRKMVKELLYTRDGEITLGSINNGHGNITVQIDQVEKCHYVAAIIPRGAFFKP